MLDQHDFIFLQGVPEAPQCGFSNMACRILDAYGETHVHGRFCIFQLNSRPWLHSASLRSQRMRKGIAVSLLITHLCAYVICDMQAWSMAAGMY